MSTTFKGGVQAPVAFTQTPGTGFLNGQALSVPLALSIAYNATGTAADQIDLVAVKSFTFVASTMQTVDLSAMTDILGNAVNFAEVVLFAIRMESTTDAATLTLAPDVTNGWAALFSSNLVLHAATATTNPNGSFFVAATPAATGWAVDSTHKVIDFTPSAHAFNATLVVAGRSV